MKSPHLEVYTIGHSTRSIEEFVELLNAAQIDLVVDVRAIPMSRTNPQYNKDALPENLKPFRIRYRHIKELGGRRKKEKDVDPAVNSFWMNRSFHNYADYALSEEFHKGLEKLLELAHTRRCAIMCSEAVWWRCHRRIIADHLIARRVATYHLMGTHKIEIAKLTPGAEIKRSRVVVYPGDLPNFDKKNQKRQRDHHLHEREAH